MITYKTPKKYKALRSNQLWLSGQYLKPGCKIERGEIITALGEVTAEALDPLREGKNNHFTYLIVEENGFKFEAFKFHYEEI